MKCYKDDDTRLREHLFEDFTTWMDRIKMHVLGTSRKEVYQYSSPGSITKQQQLLHHNYRLDDQHFIREDPSTGDIDLIDLSNDSTSTILTDQFG